ncbi:MAG: KpsF/GutQ family sugar-phosphate isomerase [Paludibacteraceae bacterium]|nr:KpsF/GutQ family sugar-phosphate isomerase [Paludibacteraceae bacterium]MBR2451500.1 KpsF/GutQ family sugar-phosphate isomerase [Paludibacteraceae bacterium]
MYAIRAKQIFEEEIRELEKLKNSIDNHFNQVVEVLYHCQGKVVMMGIGKTGIIAHKMAASFASTGTPSIFVNAAEAVHGDLGMINANDVAILVSNSGSTNEILNIIDPLHRLGCTIIAMTGNMDSPLAQRADYALSIHVDTEACPLGIAPTTSTTATLLMGDALMVCLMEMRQFKAEDFALYHPGGALGRKLLGRVHRVMTTDVPRVTADASFRDVVCEMSDKHLGMTMVYDHLPQGNCLGIITDGDIRRAIQKYNDVHITAADIMTPSYKRIAKEALLTDALAIMDTYNITTLAVTETTTSTDIIGIISIHHIIDFN